MPVSLWRELHHLTRGRVLGLDPPSDMSHKMPGENLPALCYSRHKDYRSPELWSVTSKGWTRLSLLEYLLLLLVWNTFLKEYCDLIAAWLFLIFELFSPIKLLTLLQNLFKFFLWKGFTLVNLVDFISNTFRNSKYFWLEFKSVHYERYSYILIIKLILIFLRLTRVESAYHSYSTRYTWV